MNVTGWILGTFHTAAVGLTLLFLAYPGGSLGTTLGSLSTLAGLALFVALWAITVFATTRAIGGLDLPAGVTAGYHRRALRWGALNGMLFLWASAAVLSLQQLITAPGTVQWQSLLLGAGFVAGVGSFFALTVGAVIGLALASIDLAGLALARRLA